MLMRAAQPSIRGLAQLQLVGPPAAAPHPDSPPAPVDRFPTLLAPRLLFVVAAEVPL